MAPHRIRCVPRTPELTCIGYTYTTRPHHFPTGHPRRAALERIQQRLATLVDTVTCRGALRIIANPVVGVGLSVPQEDMPLFALRVQLRSILRLAIDEDTVPLDTLMRSAETICESIGVCVNDAINTPPVTATNARFIRRSPLEEAAMHLASVPPAPVEFAPMQPLPAIDTQ